MPLVDRFARPLRSLRISVTDRCNLRCQYCMPEPEYVWLPRESLLTFEEIGDARRRVPPLGVDRVRLTGGEPLLRRDLPVLVESLAARPAHPRPRAHHQRRAARRPGAGAARAPAFTASPSASTRCSRDRFQALTRFDELDAVLAGIDAAARAGFAGLKLDTVVIRGVNDDELVALLEFGRGHRRRGPLHRVHGRRRRDALVAGRGGLAPRDARRASRRTTGRSTPLERAVVGAGRALSCWPTGPTFGIISSTTEPFCASCDRSRLTADGVWLLCLYAATGTDLRRPAPRRRDRGRDLQRLVAAVWSVRADRGAEERLAMDARRRSSRSARSSATRTSRCTRAGDRASRDWVGCIGTGASSKYPGASIQHLGPSA